jgi:bacterioferritin (cytochrome b1)
MAVATMMINKTWVVSELMKLVEAERSMAGGIGARSEIGSNPIERLLVDMSAKAEAIHRYTAWVHALESTGDAASGNEMATILADEQVHLDALQAGLDRLIEQATKSE